MPCYQSNSIRLVAAWNSKSAVASVEFPMEMRTIQTVRSYHCNHWRQNQHADKAHKQWTKHQSHKSLRTMLSKTLPNYQYDATEWKGKNCGAIKISKYKTKRTSQDLYWINTELIASGSSRMHHKSW